MKFKGPLAERYWAAVLLVVFALIPYLALSSSLAPLMKIIGAGVHLSQQALSLTNGMANAAYALGTVLAVQIAVHYPQRRALLVYVSTFVLGSVLAATALTPGLFVAGHVLQGLTTSMMLIAAVPPLVLNFPYTKLPITGAIMNMGIFGAVAAGPVIGGVQAGSGAWRPLFWIVAGVGGLALVMSLLTYEDVPAQEPQAPRDWLGIFLAGSGCGAAFFGASQLTTHRFLDLIAFGPLVLGACLLFCLVLQQYLAKNPLMPVRKLTTTIPVAMIVVAISAGAAGVALIELIEVAFMHRGSPGHVAMLFWPELGGAVFTAFLFGRILYTRFPPLFALSGMAMIAGAAAILSGVAGGPEVLVIVGSGILGLGLGSSVAPSLFATGFSLRAFDLQRVFALLELLRGTAAFMVGPIILHLAMTTGSSMAGGIQNGVWVCFAIAAAGGLLSIYILVLGRPPLTRPRLAEWEKGLITAWHSPPLFDVLRNGEPESAAEALAAWEAEAARTAATVHND
ncbi:MAG: MFS transporter [Solirubrobacterales bacterium]|nr:MFS transporter [Solirubrobacterales bacterium]